MTQNNLGNALLRLGERESGTARLEEAVAAYRAAIEAFPGAGSAATMEKLRQAERILAERRTSARQ